jgi:hypothetical protein
MREFVQSLKNHIIFKMNGQFHCGIAHFQKEKDKSVFIKENIDETIFMFALFKCGKSDKGRN